MYCPCFAGLLYRFIALKNEANTCVLSLFRRAFVLFHSFTVFVSVVSTRGFKRATLELGPGGLRV